MKMKIYLFLIPLFLCMPPLISQELDTLILDSSTDIAQQIKDDTSKTGERNPNRIYVLRCNSIYYYLGTMGVHNGVLGNDFKHLRLYGESPKPTTPDSNSIKHPPVIICSEGAIETWSMFYVENMEVSFENLILSCIGASKNQLSYCIEGSENSVINLNNCTLTGVRNSYFRNCSVLRISNCHFLNSGPVSAFYNGLIFHGPTDTLIFENNTVASFGMFTWNKSMPEYMRVNHNTFINQSGEFSPEITAASSLIWANNIHYNIGFAGRTESERIEDTDGLVPGFFHWDTTGLDTTDWRMLFTNNQTWLDARFRDYYETTKNNADTDDKIHEMPFFNARSLASAAQHTGIQIQKTFDSVDPQFTNYIDNVDSLIQFVKDVRSTPKPEWITNRHYTPILDYDTWEVNWPPELDLSYANADLLTADTDGLPLGDLNWFPEQKEIWEANKDQYTADLEEMLNNPVGVEQKTGAPFDFGLFQNYPNPFNPSTAISYQLATASKVRLEVFNVNGRSVELLVDESQHPGQYRVNLDGTGLPSGVYFARLSVNDRSDTRKMMLLR